VGLGDTAYGDANFFDRMDKTYKVRRAEDAPGTPTQSHISPSILVYEENQGGGFGRADLVHIRQSRPDSGFGFQLKALKNWTRRIRSTSSSFGLTDRLFLS